MNPTDILFVAGDVKRLSSIKIRCREIAQRLGIACHYNASSPSEVPSGYRAYICVKPDFGWQGAQTLAKKALVVWDILDDHPPAEQMLAYIASTKLCAQTFEKLGRIEVIPHYHCNIERKLCCGDPMKVGFIGSAHWYPELQEVAHERYIVDGWNREKVADAYRSIGISLNMRNLSGNYDQFIKSKSHIKPIPELHIKINSGMKLINCLGFGLPSVSASEPAYYEIAPHCTLFSDFSACASAVVSLQRDKDLYLKMRRDCLEMARAFHLDEIILKYRTFIKSL